ncbi:hypothetical protein LOZ66_000133 [Ophidiomyces ophidiicola]|nr:hypothetical protein LOZ65_004727 [Ophidiomyces ophidiicola]KAI1943550.1 hypothetical protein LOZ66_000133 [Ophidiomyces ophidiicola]
MVLNGKDVLDGLSGARSVEAERVVMPKRPDQGAKGDKMPVFRTDTGGSDKDGSSLVAVNVLEVALQRKTAEARFDIRLHFHRTNFKIVHAD